jgi:hypothetical protein
MNQALYAHMNNKRKMKKKKKKKRGKIQKKKYQVSHLTMTTLIIMSATSESDAL